MPSNYLSALYGQASAHPSRPSGPGCSRSRDLPVKFLPSWFSRRGPKPGTTGNSGVVLSYCIEPIGTGAAPVPVHGILGLGRAVGNGIRFEEKDAIVSNHHASVSLEDGRVMLKDLNSANGTWLDESRVAEIEIREGQEFSLGRHGPRFRLTRREVMRDRPLGTIRLGNETRAYVRSMGKGQETMGGWTRFDTARQKKILQWFQVKNRKQKRLTMVLWIFLALSAGLSGWLYLQVRDLKAQVVLHKALVDQLAPNMDPGRRHEAVLRIREAEKELAGMRTRLKDFAIKGIYSDPLAVKLHRAAESFGQSGFVLPDGFLDAASRHYQDLMSAYGRRKLSEALARKHGYEDLIKAELNTAGLPESLIWLAMHESRMDPKATSARGARGLWQLMPGLAAHFNLAVPENWRGLPPSADPRTRPADATKAGVKYLGKLFDQYQDPFLAMAAYNSGEPQLNSALRRMKAAPDRPLDTAAVDEAARVDEALSHVTDARFRSDYWYLQRMNLLPDETILYVPKIVATMVAAEELGG